MAKRLIALVAAFVTLGLHAGAQTYTLSPAPKQQFFDTNGVPLAAGKVCTYISGTSTPVFTFKDTSGTQNLNPVILDGSGLATIYLAAGSSYKFVVLSCANGVCSDNTCATGTTLYTQDGISAVPSGSASVDVQGLAGQTITTGQCVYLSDGSGSLLSGRWYPCDAANAYSSVLPEIGIAPAGITSGNTGTVRLVGSVPGLSALTIGPEYFVGTSGAITTTPPANRRHLGHADTTTSLVLTGNPGPLNADNGIDDFRVTASTGVPAPAVDVTAATTIYATPAGKGNRIALYDANGIATVYTSAEFSIAVPATTSQTYTVMAFASSGVPTLELATWTNDTTPGPGACVLTTTGTWTKSGDLTRRCLALMRTTTVSGQTEDSLVKRYIWNYHNRLYRPLQRLETNATWTWTTATIHQANASALNQVEVVIGVQDAPVRLALNALASNSAGTIIAAGIGLDSTTTFLPGGGMAISVTAAFQTPVQVPAIASYPGIGRHVFSWNEWSTAAGATTWSGLNATLTGVTMGLTGGIDG